MRFLRALLAAIALVPLCAQGQITNSSNPQTNPTPTALGGQISLGAFSSLANLILSFPPANLNPGTMAFTADQGEMIVFNGAWTVLGSGAGGGGGANPTAQVGLSIINGAANTFMRSDAAPALNISISPTWLGVHTFNQTIVGNINTASALFAVPTQCGGAQFATGIAANGNANCATPSGSGTVSTTGSPASGNLAKFSGATTITNGDLSGDCTTSGTLAITCTKTNGSAFVASATTDTTNAANVSSGTLPAGRMPALTGGCTSTVNTVATLCHLQQNVQTGSYTFVLADDGFEIYHNSASAHTFTIPANGSVAYSIGTCIVITNPPGSGVLTLAITTDTLTWYSAAGSTGSRTFPAASKGVICKEAATQWSLTTAGSVT